MYEYSWVVWVCEIKFKRCLFLRPSRGSQRELRSLSTNIVGLAHEGLGQHQTSREAGDGAHFGREGEKLDPDRIGGEMVARGAGGMRG